MNHATKHAALALDFPRIAQRADLAQKRNTGKHCLDTADIDRALERVRIVFHGDLAEYFNDLRRSRNARATTETRRGELLESAYRTRW